MKRTYATFIRETGAKVSSAPVPACARTSSARGQALSTEQRDARSAAKRMSELLHTFLS